MKEINKWSREFWESACLCKCFISTSLGETAPELFTSAPLESDQFYRFAGRI